MPISCCRLADRRTAGPAVDVCHYWGRQLRRWLWLSANDFDRPELAVEASVLRSQVWGRQIPLPILGYVWLEDRSATHTVASPINGLVGYGPRPAGGVNISVAGLRGRWHLQAWAAGESFINLGEGIARSLRADCLLLLPSGAALAQGVATLEVIDQEFLTSGLPTRTPSRHSPPSDRTSILTETSKRGKTAPVSDEERLEATIAWTQPESRPVCGHLAR
jgi:hypothetical protein